MPVKKGKKGKKGSGGKKKGKKSGKKGTKSATSEKSNESRIDDRPPLLRPGEKVSALHEHCFEKPLFSYVYCFLPPIMRFNFGLTKYMVGPRIEHKLSFCSKTFTKRPNKTESGQFLY